MDGNMNVELGKMVTNFTVIKDGVNLRKRFSISLVNLTLSNNDDFDNEILRLSLIFLNFFLSFAMLIARF